jgi:murein DD-endopeptidase MepM/ murein hydrolase activator NlpD
MPARYRRVLFVSFGVLAALLIFRDRSLYKAARPVNWVSEQIRKSVTPPTPPAPVFREIVGSFKPNQTVTQALLQQGLSSTLVFQIIECARPVYDLAKVKARKLYWLGFTPEGNFREFRYPVDDERYLTVYHDEAQDRIVPVVKNFQFETRVEPVSAVIESSLFSSVMDIGEKDQLALDLAEIFGSDIDFYTDIRKGDSFRVLMEKKYLNGQFSKYGAILAASFTNQQKMITGIRFEDENGKPAYYSPDGKALKKSFLKSPLKFGRITSKFSTARMHPILKILRPHLGVDYAAPTGTPVQAVGAGTVKSAGANGGSGRMIRLHHTGGYETLYLHLSRIAVRSGARVSQGDVIGYVGSSGLSTGPHLDFRVYKNGRAINPLKVIFPPGAPVSRAALDRFNAVRDSLISQLSQIQPGREQLTNKAQTK